MKSKTEPLPPPPPTFYQLFIESLLYETEDKYAISKAPTNLLADIKEVENFFAKLGFFLLFIASFVVIPFCLVIFHCIMLIFEREHLRWHYNIRHGMPHPKLVMPKLRLTRPPFKTNTDSPKPSL